MHIRLNSISVVCWKRTWEFADEKLGLEFGKNWREVLLGEMARKGTNRGRKLVLVGFWKVCTERTRILI